MKSGRVPVILLPGEITATKGYLRFIQLMPALIKQCGPVEVFIPGKFKRTLHEEYRSDFLKALAASPFKKRLKREQLDYANADIVVLPFEAGRSIVEFNAAVKSGKPLICSDLLIFRKAAAGKKRVTIIDNEEKLISAIAKQLKGL
ncbi:MAG: glycosyltransferase [Fibrobacteres bacterium]|nr:glycosyltransferase [Fibrobacterota bacterium]